MEQENNTPIKNNNVINQELLNNLKSQVALLEIINARLISGKLSYSETAIYVTREITHTAESLANYYDVTYPKTYNNE